MGRNPCCLKEEMNRGAWTALEDKILTDYIEVHGEGRWGNLPKKAGLKRCGKSCRLRWLNYLRPDIKRGNITHDEEELVIRLHKLLGNRWSLIAGRLPGRTDNEIKNYWNTNLRKKTRKNHQKSSPANNCKSPQCSNHSDDCKIKMSGGINATPSSPLLTAPKKEESHVFRTKAMRCTKVMLNQQPADYSTYTNQMAKLSMENTKDLPIDNMANENLNMDGGNIGSDLMMDFKTNDISLLDNFLGSDFSDLCNFSYCDDSEGSYQLTPALTNQPNMKFSDEMLDNWAAQDDWSHPNVTSYFLSLPSFLES